MMLSGHNMPLIFAQPISRIFEVAYQNGMIGTDYDALFGQYGVKAPNLYVLARKHTHPLKPVDQILDEYFAAFGPAEPAVRRYVDYWRQITRRLARRKEDFPRYLWSWGNHYRLMPQILTAEVLQDSWAMLDEAERLAQGHAQAAERVEFLRVGLKHAELTAAAEAAHAEYEQRGAVRPYIDAMRALYAYRREVVEKTNTSNLGQLEALENRTWDLAALKLMEAREGEPLPTRWRFRFDPDDQGIDRGWFEPGFDDAAWRWVPTTKPWEKTEAGRAWKAEHGRDYDGFAWYRLSFDLPKPESSARYRLVFGAVDEACKVWINGELVLDRPYPYNSNRNSWAEPFEVDFTEVARPGRRNTVAVRVEDNRGAGGIWKPVYLIVAEPADADARNLIDNGGFESAAIVPWQRSVMVGRYALSIDHETSFTGNSAAMIRAVDLVETESRAQRRGWARWLIKGDGLDTGRAYRFTVKVRTDPSYNGVVAVWYRDGGNDRASSRSRRLLNTEGLWRTVTLEPIHPDRSTFRIFLNAMGGNGTVWFDDAHMTPIESTPQP